MSSARESEEVELDEKNKRLLTVVRRSEKWLSAAHASNIDVADDSELHTFSIDNLGYYGNLVDTYEASGGYGEFHVQVIEFDSVFAVQALDIPTEGFHLSLDDAVGEAEDIASCYQPHEEQDR
jgi:hypothetical protein